jgi:hypothetical protein
MRTSARATHVMHHDCRCQCCDGIRKLPGQGSWGACQELAIYDSNPVTNREPPICRLDSEAVHLQVPCSAGIRAGCRRVDLGQQSQYHGSVTESARGGLTGQCHQELWPCGSKGPSAFLPQVRACAGRMPTCHLPTLGNQRAVAAHGALSGYKLRPVPAETQVNGIASPLSKQTALRAWRL